MGVFYDFAGRRINEPGTYTKRIFPENEGAGALIGEVVLLGEASKGGVPYNAEDKIEDVLNIVSGQSQALEVFGGGDLYYGAEFYLTPTKDDRFNTPSQAKCIVVNQMTQAETSLQASAVDIIDIKSKKYGTDGNTYAIKISAGSNVGKLIEVIYKGETVLEKDDVNLTMISIQYVGAGTSATMSITDTTLSTTITGGPGGEDLSITLADFEDLGSLINFINNQPAYTCLLTGKSDENPLYFDIVTTQDIKTSAYESLGIVEAIIRQLRSLEDLDVELSSGATRVIPDNLSEYQYFTGGTVSIATTQDWTDALIKLESYQLNNIVVMTGSETIHALVKSHVESMNDLQKAKYRQSGFGSGSSVNTKALRIAEMKSLNSAYLEYCVSEFDRYDYVNKERKTFDPYYLYAMISGLRYANSVGMDVVFKYLNVLSTPEIKSEDRSDYIDAGATIIQLSEDASSGSQFEIKSNNTTYQGSVVTRTNPATVYLINVLTKDQELKVKEQIRKLDKVANSVIISGINNWVLTELYPDYRDNKGWITNGPDGQKAFEDVSFELNGEVWQLKATLTMSITPRFAFITNTFVVPGQRI